jgi:hypothetical protein
MGVLFPGQGDSSLVDQYQVTLAKSGTLTIQMDSAAVDAFLLLFSSVSQNPLALDDDGGGGTNARISIHLSANTYLILANTATTNATTGAYTLTLSFAPDIWTPTSTTAAPDARTQHAAVWTGSQMIIWGGHDGNAIAKNTGGRFDPQTDTWTPTSTVGAPSARLSPSAVWTGTEMIVWGGFSGAFAFQTLNDGAKYNPQTNTWAPVTSVGAPTARFGHTAVWTGTEMIVWGGNSCTACPNPGVDTGAKYNPATDSWSPTSAVSAPSPRGFHTAVWTGSKMVVWGGQNDTTLLDTGGVYDPASDGWAPTTVTGAPIPRSLHASVWTGSSMIVFGGRFSNISAGGTDTGGIYDPVADQWTPTQIVGAPIFDFGFETLSSVWTGTEFIAWSGTGGRFDPVANSWKGVSASSAPSARRNHTLVWTGSAMIVWGGDFAGPLNTGGIYDPSADQTP